MIHHTKTCYIAATICSVFILYLFTAFYFRAVYTPTDSTFYELNNGWSYQSEADSIYTDTMPSKLPADADSSVTLSTTLPAQVFDSDILMFRTTHINIWVYVDDTLIYENTAGRFRMSKSNGNICHFVGLKPSMAGKKLSIVYQDCYSKASIRFNPVTFGDERDILQHLISSKLPDFLICALTFFIGAIGLLCYIIFRRQMPLSAAPLFWLFLFAMAFSVWSGLETQLPGFLLPYPLAFSWFTHVALKLLLIPILSLMGYIYQINHTRLFRLLTILSFLDIVINSALQFLGIFDFKETLFVTHLLLFTTLIWIFVLSLSILFKKKKADAPNVPGVYNQLYVLFTLILAVTVLLDFFTYYITLNTDSSKFSRITLLTFIIALAIIIVRSSLESQKLKEKEDSLVEMATIDPLTKLKNRATFEKDIAAIPDNELTSYGIAMFDLNKLKYFNDVHGHSMGDYYIIICSEILQDLFYSYGNLYRIGGDEFCAVIKDVSPEKYTQLSPMIASRLEALHQTMFACRMEIADGYAAFDSHLDQSLLHTMERADKKMYTKKQAMKAADKQNS